MAKRPKGERYTVIAKIGKGLLVKTPEEGIYQIEYGLEPLVPLYAEDNEQAIQEFEDYMWDEKGISKPVARTRYYYYY